MTIMSWASMEWLRSWTMRRLMAGTSSPRGAEHGGIVAAGQDHHIVAREGVGFDRDLVDAIHQRVHQHGRVDIGLDARLTVDESHRSFASKPPGPPSGPLKVTSKSGSRSAISPWTWPRTLCHSPRHSGTWLTAGSVRNANSAPSVSILAKVTGPSANA